MAKIVVVECRWMGFSKFWASRQWGERGANMLSHINGDSGDKDPAAQSFWSPYSSFASFSMISTQKDPSDYCFPNTYAWVSLFLATERNFLNCFIS